MNDTDPKKRRATDLSLSQLRGQLGSVADAISGGQEVSIADLDKPPPVTDETEAAYKAAQRKKAEEGGGS